MYISQLPELPTHDGTVEFPAAFNGADYKLPLKALLMKKTVTGSTNTNGNILLDLDTRYAVLGVIRTGTTGNICTPFYNPSLDGWAAHLTTTGASPSAVVSTAVELVVFYLPCDYEVVLND